MLKRLFLRCYAATYDLFIGPAERAGLRQQRHDLLAQATGATIDPTGRIEVGSDLTIPGHPEISVIGDVASVEGPGGRALPGLATVAIQQGRHVAKAICDGRPGATTPFQYFDKGALAVVGRGRAICQVRGIELYGPPAFLTYLGVHLYYLGGVGGRRLQVLTAWGTSGLGALQNRVIEGQLASLERSASGSDRGLEVTRDGTQRQESGSRT